MPSRSNLAKFLRGVLTGLVLGFASGSGLAQADAVAATGTVAHDQGVAGTGPVALPQTVPTVSVVASVTTPVTVVALPPVMPSGVDASAAALPPVLYGIQGGGSVELGQKVALRLVFADEAGGLAFKWKKGDAVIAGATASIYEIAAAVAADAATYAVEVSNSAGASSASVELTVKSAAAPVIMTQPRTLIMQFGQTAYFAYLATGSYPRTHQWRKNGLDLPGATGGSLTLNAVTSADDGTYSVVITNSLGTVTSAEASLTVQPATPVVMGKYDPSDQTVTQGSWLQFWVFNFEGSGPFTYQWLKDGVAIPGATELILNFDAVTLADAGKYSLRVTNPIGSATSREATLTVTPATPVTIYSHPGSQTVFAGQPTFFIVHVLGSSPITYQWRKNGVPIDGATNSSYSHMRATLADAGTYSVVATNAAGSALSAGAVLTVKPAVPPVISQQPIGKTAAYGDTVNLSVQATGSPDLEFQWRKDGVAIGGATASSYSISSATPAHSGVYSVFVTNGGGAATSNGATLTVLPAVAPAITQHPVNQSLVYGSSLNLSVKVTGSPSMSFQWKKDGVALESSNSASYSVSYATLANSGVYTVAITNVAGTVTSQGATITVQPAIAPAITKQPVGQTVAYNDYLGLTVEATGTAPLSYQWKKDGESLGSLGAASYYQVYSAKPANSGVYTVVVTNPGGTVTSQEATVTVQAAIAPTITTQPVGQTLAYGDTLRLSAAVSGSLPLSYQWKKDGVSLGPPGASQSYVVYGATPANSGVYTLAVTNPGGTVTSASATVKVQAAIAPTITTQPQSQTVAYFSDVSLSVQVSGSPPLSYQWKKDGENLSGWTSNSRSLYSVTPTNSGTYTVVVTNPAGSITSSAATLTVQAVVIPKITTQPIAQEVATGLPASFSAKIDATGAGVLAYQWRKNGVAINGATSTEFRIPAVSAANAGDYTLVVTGLGGAVTTLPAKLTVLPLAPPTVANWPSASQVTVLGANPSIQLNSVLGSPPFSYQWARNGVPIAGVTGSSLSIEKVTESDLTSYTVTISNMAGVITSPPIQLRLPLYSAPAATPWLDAGRVDDVVYFLATNPARIERFDLATESWSPTVLLTDGLVPTAFAPAGNGIYLAYGRTLARRSLDLATEKFITTTASSTDHLFALGDYVYYSGSGSIKSYGSINRITLEPGPTVLLGIFGPIHQVATAPSLHKVFMRTMEGLVDNIRMFTVEQNGWFSTTTEGSTYYDFSFASRTFVLPGDDRVADDSGTVYSTADLKFAGSFASAFTDLAFLGDGTAVILRNRTLTTAHTRTFLETGRTTLPRPGLRLFTLDSSVFVFGASLVSGGTYSVTKVAAGAFGPIPATATSAAPIGRYSVDDAFLGKDNVVHVFSRSLQGLVRWSADTRLLLPTIGLRNAPVQAFHQPGNSRALFTYPDGLITEVPLVAAAGSELALGALNLKTVAIADLGDAVALNIAYAEKSGSMRMLLNAADNLAIQMGTGNPLAWQGGTRRLYSANVYNSWALGYETVPESDQLRPGVDQSDDTPGLQPPLRFNPEGSLATTCNGRVVNADLQVVGALANDILDAAWLPGGLYTLRSRLGATEVQQWARTTYLLTRSVPLSGTPVRIFRISDTQLVVVTALQGIAAFTVLNGDLAVSTSPTPRIVASAVPLSQAAPLAGAVTFTASQTGADAGATYRWLQNGTAVAGGTGATLNLPSVQPSNVGLYTAVIGDSTGSTTTEPSILALSTTKKAIGFGAEIGANIVHANGNVYDQVLLQGAAACVTADAGQVLRISYIDPSDDIVQVEFSGAGTLCLVLSGSSGPAAPSNYNQPGVSYMKGLGGIVITGADETTNVSVFSVGRVTATNQALFRSDVVYDGMADLAYIAIASRNGKFGGVRAANASFFNAAGPVGLYAPDVQFTGPVYLGNIDAFGDATPMLVLDSAADARITGGDLQQTNSRAVKVKGLFQLRFTAGSTSHGTSLPAQTRQARFDKNGVDVTDTIVMSPSP